jgi:hypothetical protein
MWKKKQFFILHVKSARVGLVLPPWKSGNPQNYIALIAVLKMILRII